MRIILCNKFYYYRGGDCIYCINLENLLRLNSHEVAIFSMNFPENLDSGYSEYFPKEVSFSGGGIKSKIEALSRFFSPSDVRMKFQKLIDDFKPDVVHLNNIHSYISPVIAEVAKNNNIKVVWTLHDYKLICPTYSCLNNSEICEDCFKDKRYVLKKKCMKNSSIASLIAYLESIYWNKRRIESLVDQYICPSHFMKEKMKQGGYNDEKLLVLPNFCDFNPNDILKKRNNSYCIYIGRLSKEKGISTLLKAVSETNVKLLVAGTGPLERELKSKYSEYKNICFLGHINRMEINKYLGEADFSVIPSEWYENNPLSVIESLLLGTPVLGANIGGIPELVNNNNGLLFESGNIDELKIRLRDMFNLNFDYQNISDRAFELYNKESYYHKLINIYNL